MTSDTTSRQIKNSLTLKIIPIQHSLEHQYLLIQHLKLGGFVLGEPSARTLSDEMCALLKLKINSAKQRYKCNQRNAWTYQASKKRPEIGPAI